MALVTLTLPNTATVGLVTVRLTVWPLTMTGVLFGGPAWGCPSRTRSRAGCRPGGISVSVQVAPAAGRRPCAFPPLAMVTEPANAPPQSYPTVKLLVAATVVAAARHGLADLQRAERAGVACW